MNIVKPQQKMNIRTKLYSYMDYAEDYITMQDLWELQGVRREVL